MKNRRIAVDTQGLPKMGLCNRLSAAFTQPSGNAIIFELPHLLFVPFVVFFYFLGGEVGETEAQKHSLLGLESLQLMTL